MNTLSNLPMQARPSPLMLSMDTELGASMASLQDFGQLAPAEQMLLVDAIRGEECVLGRARPEASDSSNEIRAEFVRFLALGGDARSPVHESGLRLRGAYIEGAINLDGARTVRPLWIQKSTLTGEFSFADAETKVLSLDGSSVPVVRADGAKVDGSLLLRRTFIAGDLRLFGADLTGSLSCYECVIRGRPWQSQRIAIDLSTASIGGNVQFRDGFEAHGVIRFDDSEIGGHFDCSDGKFYAGYDASRAQYADRWDRSMRAIKCHRLNLKGSLYLRGSESTGELSFSGAQIGGDIDCRSARVARAGNGDETALRFTRVEAGGNIYLSQGFAADGKVQLNGARVRGNIDCRGGTFSVPENVVAKDFAARGEAFSEDAVSFVNAEVGGALIVAPLDGKDGAAAVFNGSLDLKSAHIKVLVDSADSWPKRAGRKAARNVIHLDGFTYDRFAGAAPVEASVRKSWLKLQPAVHLNRDFKPQPFEQVIKVLKAMGHPEEARKLAIERQGFLVRRRLAQWRTGPRGAIRAVGALIWAATVGLLIGHGYRPLRVLFIMAAAGFACGFYFKIAAEKGVFAPRDAQVFTSEQLQDCRPVNGGNWTRCMEKVGDKFAEYPQFNPWVYSFNVLLPVVDLQQEKSWVPMARQVQLDFGNGRIVTVPEWGTNAIVLAELVFGWVASLLAVAAFSGLVKTE